MKRTKMFPGAVAIKLDMVKAFDRMEWVFIIKIMECLGFSSKWCQLINQCISTSSISILLNGSPTPAFTPTRGLRQGDALSPYLFILCMEDFSRMLQNAESAGLISPLQPVRGSPKISHLFFADDCILFSSAAGSSIPNLMKLLNQFCEISGQMVSLHKSSIHFSNHMNDTVKASISDSVKMQRIQLKDKYLGIPLFIGRNKQSCCTETVDKMNSRLQAWQGKLVNQAGRSTQIQAAVGVMAHFQMSCMKIPNKTVDQIEALQWNYWWNKNSSKGYYGIGWNRGRN